MKELQKHSDRNLITIQNFILHMTHCDIDGGEDDYNKPFSLTPEQMYQCALDYIEEDHVDGKSNSEDIIPNFTVESSYTFEDKGKEFPEDVVVVADFGDETETVCRITDIDNLESVKRLIDVIKNPYK